jgi:hypothetical protein
MKLLPLSNSSEQVIVDDDIWLRVCGYTWRLKQSGAGPYVVRTAHVWEYKEGKRRRKSIIIRLHRLVIPCPEGKEIHHKNGYLDNRRESLEAVDPSPHRRESGCKRWKNTDDVSI